MNKKSLRILEFDKVKERIKKYAQTSAAKDIIYGLEPYDSVFEVRQHLKETDEAFNLLTKKGNPPFEGLFDVREAINNASKGATLFPGQLLKIAQLLHSARRFKSFIAHKEDEEGYPVLEDICAGIVPLKKIEEKIFNAIIGENEIADRASTKLFNIRNTLRVKNTSVKDRVNAMVRANSKYLQENLYTIRGDRYVLPVKAEHKSSVPGLVHDQSSSGATLFIEPMSLVNLNNEIKELKLKEKAEIERILAELSSDIYDNINAVRNDANIIWELDFIFAKAHYASDLDCILPIINEDGIIDIIDARHPLIDAKEVVSNSIYLGREFTSLIVTGPNTGGKTVTLKTIGIIEIMAMSGLLIPAKQNSIVSYFDEIFADIGDEQSIEQSLSTFSSHMKNIVNIIDKADYKSLVLFDELGAGTDPTEGAALAVSILENLRKRNCKIAATTHYSEMKGYALKTIGVENASVEFDVETLRPTYKLLIGVPGKSNAFEISRRLGLPEYIISYAKQNISKDTMEFENLIQSLQDKNIKAEKDAIEAEILKMDAEKLKKRYVQKLGKLENIREKAIIEAQKEAKRVIREAKNEADDILKNIRKLESMGYSSNVRQKLEKERKKLKDKLDVVEENLANKSKNKGEKLKSVEEGQEVLLSTINQNVIVLSKPDKKGEVLVQAGIMKINVKLNDLRAIKESSSTTSKVNYSKRESKLNMNMVSSSVDLRGMDSEEAIYTADKYLDDAYLAGLGEVTIIHGKGTGVLRKAITNMLKRHPHVKSYRIGIYGEGGNGVTVVELK